MLEAYQEQNTTGEPGLRWVKSPAAIAPVWLEKPERIPALAMLTVVGRLVGSCDTRTIDPGDTARIELLLAELRLPAIKLV